MARNLRREAGDHRPLYVHAKAHGNVWLVADGEITS